jgi:uncharacterized protein
VKIIEKVMIVWMVLLGSLLYGQQAPAFDKEHGHVLDQAGLFSVEEIRQLDSILTVYDDSTSIDIIVAATKDRGGYTMSDYTQDLFDTLQPGKKGLDNGIILHISMDPAGRQVRIQPGYGIEGDLPDVVCGHIIDDSMFVPLKEGHYFQATKAGVDGIIAHLGNDAWQQREAYRRQQDERRKETLRVLGRILIYCAVIGIIVTPIILIVSRKRKRREMLKEISRLVQVAESNLAQAKSRLSKALEALESMRSGYPPSTTSEFGDLEEKLAQANRTLTDSTAKIRRLNDSRKVSQALGVAQEVSTIAEDLSKLIASAPTKLKGLEQAKKDFPTALKFTQEMFLELEPKILVSGVGDTTRELVASAKSKLAKAEAMALKEPVDWLVARRLLAEAALDLSAAQRQAYRDLHPVKVVLDAFESSMASSTHHDSGSGHPSGGGGSDRGGRSGGGGAERSF